MGIFTSVALGWLGRRVPDVGGWLLGTLGTLLTFYSLMPADIQQTLMALLTSNWSAVSLPAIIGFVSWAVSQVLSFRATVKPQVVTPDGNKVAMKELPKAAQTVVVEKAETAVAKRPTIKDIFARRPK